MSWLDSLPPKIRAFVTRAETPDNLWTKCPGCGAMLFHKELEDEAQVCRHCGWHLRLDAARRLDLLLDAGWQKIDLPKVPVDPLKFRDRERYTDRLKKAQVARGESDALRIGAGHIHGLPAVLSVFDFNFMGGSMGQGVGEGLVASALAAVERRAAWIVVPASGGARMQEGILSLMQMPRSTIAVRMVKEAGLPYIVLLTDPTTGGVSASFAMLGDITLSEPGAVIGFAGQRVIEETIREKLPEGFQRAEYLLEHGMVDLVVPRAELKATLATLLGHLLPPPPAATAA